MISLLASGLLGALALAATWVVLFGIAASVGFFVHALLLPRPQRLSSTVIVAAFWTGIATTILFLQLWHLAFAINVLPFAMLAAVGLGGFVLYAKPLHSWWGSLDRRSLGSTTLLLLLAVLWAAHRATAEVANFDTYMYHVPVVEWLRQHAIVPGLGNLHERFAFNNTSLLYAALVESGPWTAASTYITNGVFILALLVQIAGRVRTLQDGTPGAPAVFDLVLLAPVLAILCYPPMFNGLLQDVPAAAAVFAGFSLLVGAAYGAQHEPATRGALYLAALGALATGVTFKLSVAAVAMPAWAIGTYSAFRAPEIAEPLRRRILLVASALSLATGLLWVSRGYILSGYPAYPSTVAAASVDWRVPTEAGRASYDWIRLFARYDSDPSAYNGHAWLEFVCSPRAWLVPWIRHLVHGLRLWQLPVPAALALLFSALAITRRARERRPTTAWLLPLAPLIGIVAWWVIAPRPLFGFWAFWLLAATTAALATPALPIARTTRRAGLAFAFCVMAMPLLGAGLNAARLSDENNYVAAASVLFVRPDPDSWFQPTRWEFPTGEYVTESGLTLTVARGHRCGRAPLPCTSHPAPNLELREPDDLASGFRVSGGWQSERWPNPWTAFLGDWKSTPRCERRSFE